ERIGGFLGVRGGDLQRVALSLPVLANQFFERDPVGDGVGKHLEDLRLRRVADLPAAGALVEAGAKCIEDALLGLAALGEQCGSAKLGVDGVHGDAYAGPSSAAQVGVDAQHLAGEMAQVEQARVGGVVQLQVKVSAALGDPSATLNRIG